MNLVKILSFQNVKTGLVTQLHMGFIDNVPHYQFNSKEIPITGEFTGFPLTIMCKWMESIGYKHFSTVPVTLGNRYEDAYKTRDQREKVRSLIHSRS